MNIRKLWLRWSLIARKIGEWQSKVLLTIFYFVISAPFALVLKLVSDPLRIKTDNTDSFWLKRKKEKLYRENARKQY